MENIFISDNLSLRIKELGFNEKCIKYNNVEIPTYCQVLEWLSNKNFSIFISCNHKNEERCFNASFYHSSDCFHSINHFYSSNDIWEINDFTYEYGEFKTYREALISTLEHCVFILENTTNS